LMKEELGILESVGEDIFLKRLSMSTMLALIM